MTSLIADTPARGTDRTRLALRIAAVSLLALAAAGCRQMDEPAKVLGWSLVDATQRHPIMVSQKPATIAVRVARGAHGLSPHQRAQVLDFVDHYRSAANGNSRMVISAPAGSANEVAAMQAVAEIRHELRQSGFDETAVQVEAYHDERDPQPPIRVSFMRYVAEAPECGQWPTNLADDTRNLHYPNFGCATQRNFAMQVANPADLLGPRGTTERSGSRRDQVWDKYVKGESTITQKQSEEKLVVKGSN
jgi:pilus assembly protein CpaD